MTIEDPPPRGELVALGWDAGWAAAFAAVVSPMHTTRNAEPPVPARVVAEHRDRYLVATADGDRSAVLAGRLRHETTSREDLPAVGDWVAVSRLAGGGTVSLLAVLPRRTAFVRKAAGETTVAQVVAANVDVALVATALPFDLNMRRLERYLTLAWESGAMPVVVLTKADLSDDPRAAIIEAALTAPGVDVVAVSATAGEGVATLDRHLRPARTAVLVGSSGVGKSTLVNRLLGAERLRTAAVDVDGRGRHTTTHRELVRLANGALLIDTPGMRELQLWSTDAGLGSAFADVEACALRCRFGNCTHESEPDCGVLMAIARGELAAERLEHWHRLRREVAHLARKQDELATAEERGRIKRLTRGLRRRLRDKYGDS